jgi:hypothetical protein
MKAKQSFAMILMLTAAAGLANAQATSSSDDQDLLRGPAVTENSSTDKKSDSMQEVSVEAELAERPMLLRELLGTIRALSSENSGNILKLTDEQRSNIKEIEMTYRAEIREFQDENLVEIRKLRDQMNTESNKRREQRQKEADTNDQVQDAMQGDDAATQEDKKAKQPKEGEAAKKLREMINNAPPAKKAISALNAELSEKQLELVKERVVKNRARQKENMERRTRSQRERNTAKRGADGQEVSPAQDRKQRQRKDRDNSED